MGGLKKENNSRNGSQNPGGGGSQNMSANKDKSMKMANPDKSQSKKLEKVKPAVPVKQLNQSSSSQMLKSTVNSTSKVKIIKKDKMNES